MRDSPHVDKAASTVLALQDVYWHVFKKLLLVLFHWASSGRDRRILQRLLHVLLVLIVHGSGGDSGILNTSMSVHGHLLNMPPATVKGLYIGVIIVDLRTGFACYCFVTSRCMPRKGVGAGFLIDRIRLRLQNIISVLIYY